jgi:putative membrane protein
MKYVIAILKGILVGLAVLIPGVSGGSMIMTMGIYEQAISITSRDKKVRRAAILFLIPYGVGIVVGILGLAFIIKWLMERYLFETALCFIGMILGSLPMLYKKVKGEKFSLVGAILFVLMVVIMIALPHLSSKAGGEGHLTVGLWGAVMAVILGFIGAGTMIVPGISGSMVMLVLGYYNDIISHITGLKDIVKGGLSGAAIPWDHVFALGFFAVGALVGLLLVSRWIKWLLGHHPVPTYYAIMGLMLASPYPIFIKSGLDFSAMGTGHIVAGCVTLVLGFALALFLDRQGEKAEQA